MSCFSSIFLVCWMIALAGGAQPPALDVKTWTGLAEREWSPLALRLCRKDAGTWSFIEGDGFVVGGRSSDVLRQAAREAEAAQEYFAKNLGLTARPPARAVILLIEGRAEWLDLVQRSHLRTDGVALQVGREIYMHACEPAKVGKVAHEMMHFLNRSLHRLPLWLDEGLALHWGWQALHAAGIAPYMPRRLEPILDEDLLPLDSLTSRTEYPESDRATLGFYRETEEVAITLGLRFGEQGLAELVHDIMHRSGQWRSALAARGMDAEAVAAWEREVLRRCRESRVAP